MSCLGSYSAWLVMYSPPLRHFRQTVEEVTTHSQEGQWNTFCKQPCTSLRSCFKPLVYTCVDTLAPAASHECCTQLLSLVTQYVGAYAQTVFPGCLS